jgi:probable rRNA maturation factor
MMMSATLLDLKIHASIGRRYVPFLRRNIQAAHRLVRRCPLREMSVALVNDVIMSSLHQQFMNLPAPTDVLSFPLEMDQRGRATSGEVVICVPEARRRAAIDGTSVPNELLLYAIHGLLHLSGMDDRTQRGFAQMHRMEDQILVRLGIGPVFQQAASPKRPRATQRGGTRR